nr:MAG TPA: hypothetical protein [Caudoviricetes sp.]
MKGFIKHQISEESEVRLAKQRLLQDIKSEFGKQESLSQKQKEDAEIQKAKWMNELNFGKMGHTKPCWFQGLSQWLGLMVTSLD